MEDQSLVVVDDAPAAADLALLEEKVAAAAIDAAGLGQELAVLVRDDDGQILAGISGLVWGGYCSCTQCGSTRRSEVTASRVS